VNPIMDRRRLSLFGPPSLLFVMLSASVASAAPKITITSPADGTTTTNRSTQIIGRVEQASSSHVRVTCNDRPVSLEAGAIHCTIALYPGVNAIAVRAVDADGESASAVLRVSRKTSTGLVLVPNAVTVAINRVINVSAVTSSGHPATNVGWRVADRSKVSLEPYNAQIVLAGTSLGRTSISARTASQIANARVSVVGPGPFPVDLPLGTPAWAVGPIPGLRQRSPLNAVPIAGSPPSDVDSVAVVEGCDLFAVDADPAGRFTVVRGLRNSGDLVWIGRIPGTPLAGDVFGGLLALVGPIGKSSKVLGRFDRADATAGVWRFYANGVIEDAAQSGDGTIYLVEDQQSRKQIVVIDGRSGAVEGRVSLQPGAMLGSLVGLDDNSALVQVRDERGLSLAHVTLAGIETVTLLSATGTLQPDAEPGPAIQTRNGDTVALWSDRVGLHLSLVRGSLVAAELTTQSTVPRRRQTWSILIDAFDSPWVYVSDGARLEAFDLDGRQRRWQRQTSAVPFEAIHGRHVVVSDTAKRRVMEIDERGNAVVTMHATVQNARIVVQGNGVFHGFDPVTRSVVEVDEPAYQESGWFSVFSFTTTIPLERKHFRRGASLGTP
jgi:hypothetical protein